MPFALGGKGLMPNKLICNNIHSNYNIKEIIPVTVIIAIIAMIISVYIIIYY